MSKIYDDVGINYNKGKRKRYSVAPGCYFEPAEPEGDVITGVKKSVKKVSYTKYRDEPYRRNDGYDTYKDNFAERMMGSGETIRKKSQDDVKVPENFVVSVAYNKGGYQVIPKEDL